MATQLPADQQWGKLAEAEETARQSAMTARYLELAELSEEDRRERLLAMARAEYALPDAQLRLFTRSRIRTWLDIPADKVQLIARSYDAAMDKLPGRAAMQRVEIVQTLAREFSQDEVERLHTIVPRVFGLAPTEMAKASLRPMSSPQASEKPWWAFWRAS